MPKTIRSVFSVVALLAAATGIAEAAPLTLDGMAMVNHWFDYENQAGDLPPDVWGTSDITLNDRVGIWVEFDNGLQGSATYSGVSGLWNSFFTGIAADSATGFFTTAGDVHYLFNDGTTLPMAWNGFSMTYAGNFDLDYNESLGSNFRASVAGWVSAEFATYSNVPEPSTLALTAFAFVGLAAWGWRPKRSRCSL